MPTRTSPILPPIRNDAIDSGFGSGNLDDDLFGENGMISFNDYFTKGAENLEIDFSNFDDKNFNPVFEENNGPASLTNEQPPVEQADPPASQPVTVSNAFLPPPTRPIERSQSFTPVVRPQTSMSSPKLAPAPFPRARQITEEQVKALPVPRKRDLPPVPASDPGVRKLERSQTWAPDSDVMMSEAPTGPENSQPAKPKSKKKVGKEQTRARLENAIAAGEMPPYCDNCGSIETPAWRRGFAKVFDCPYDEVETGLASGDVVYKHPLDYNKDGSIKTWRGYKCERRPEDETNGWEQICLCNREYTFGDDGEAV
jgi:hypothetical protein